MSTAQDSLMDGATEDYDAETLAAIEDWISRTCLDIPPGFEEEDTTENDEDEEDADDEEPTDDDEDRPLHAVVTEPDNLWENGKIITYGFLGPSPECGTPRQQHKVIKVLTNTPSTWKDYANVKFKYLPSSSSSGPESPSEVPLVRLQFIRGTASWAHIGKRCKDVAPDMPTMNLGWIADDNNLSDIERAVILHEFGHVLGLMHEHQSPAMSGVITLKEQHVKLAYWKTHKWSEKQVEEQVLRPYRESELTNYSVFDPKSIMMYFMPKEMNNEGIDIASNDALSTTDKAFVAVHYPYFGPKPPPHPDARIENALRALGIAPNEDDPNDNPGDDLLPLDDDVPEEPTEEEKAAMMKQAEERERKLQDKERVMQLYRKGDWAGIRDVVKEIYVAVREERMKEVMARMKALGKK